MRLIVYLHAETPLAVRVSDKPGSERVWIPKSLFEEVSRNPGDLGEPDLLEMDIEDWIAEREGLA